MPGVNVLKIIGNVLFMAKQIKLPASTATDNGGDKAWSEAYFKDRKDADMGGVPQVIPPWFMPQKPGFKPHQKTCDDIGKNFKDFHDSMLDAIAFSHDMWKLQVKFKDLQIAAVAVIGSPGCLDGPKLDIANAPQCASMTGNMAKMRDAVAKGVADTFKKWQDKVTIPGLPLFPAFAAFPGPMAPPMPNVPVPLIACISAMLTSIALPDDMVKAMDDALPQDLKDKDPEKHYHALHQSIAQVMSLAFLIWLPSQMMSLVLGKGPIPTFAPPFVPVGPVVGGDNIAIPGHLMA